MRFRVERDVLAEAVAWAARSLPARPPVPVLAGLMLDAADGRLVLSSFDYEVSARVEVPAEVTEAGAALVSGRLLADISRSLPSRPVDVATDASKVALVELCARVQEAGGRLVDVQEQTPHLASLGQVLVRRSDYLDVLTALRVSPVRLAGDRRPVARLAPPRT